ncbi:discoidin domain-containing receptor 2 isoform X2 [Vespula maculifrons]|uniref:Discoidin domain-containing receptor 2 isoform X2 n=1 Tax=Vespula maculifrons TaxID=7453 RepID=A0ABD2BJ48_VESMC
MHSIPTPAKELSGTFRFKELREERIGRREKAEITGRLRQDKGGGAWCPKNMVTKEGKEYLEVNLHSPRVLMSVRTQGRFGNGHGVEYTEEYFVEYWRPGFNKWVRWRNRRGTEVGLYMHNMLTEIYGLQMRSTVSS